MWNAHHPTIEWIPLHYIPRVRESDPFHRLVSQRFLPSFVDDMLSAIIWWCSSRLDSSNGTWAHRPLSDDTDQGLMKLSTWLSSILSHISSLIGLKMMILISQFISFSTISWWNIYFFGLWRCGGGASLRDFEHDQRDSFLDGFLDGTHFYSSKNFSVV